MIVSSCNVLTMAEIQRVVGALNAGPVPRVITPGVVYKALGRRPQCGCCLSAVAKVIEHSLEGCCRGRAAKLET